MSSTDGQDLPGPLEPAAPQDTMSELVGYIVNRLFLVGLSLDSAHSIVPKGPAGDRIAAATDQVDRLIHEICDHMFAEHAQGPQAGVPQKNQPDDQDRSAQTVDRAALLQQHMTRTARSLQASAANYAALLQRTADLASQPQQMDYQTEIKRWRAFADKAEEMAKRWEQRP